MALYNNGHDVAGHTLPTPTDTPQRTSSRRFSRESPHVASSSPFFSSPPPQSYHEDDSQINGHQGNKDTRSEESRSALDPRRFTPTLHASLVSEILSLRREIGSQNSLVENLEENLHSARIENESLNNNLRNSAKESRSIKRQMQLLEGGTLSALGDLARERDEAFETLVDTRRRLEASQKIVRAQGDHAERTHAIWERDRQLWDTERRQLDTKVHIVEGRLKAVLAEVAAAQTNGHWNLGAGDEDEERHHYSHIRRGSDTVSNRSNSVEGQRWRYGIRKGLSRSPTPNGFPDYKSARLNGISLAEELESEDEAGIAIEESEIDEENNSLHEILNDSPRRPRPFSAMSYQHDRKARKVLGLSTDESEHLVDDHVAVQPGGRHVKKQDRAISGQTRAALHYSDAETQFSPPPSPKQASPPVEKPYNEQLPVTVEHAANQRRKRVSMQAPLSKPPSMSALAMPPPEPKAAEERNSTPWTPTALENRLALSEFIMPPVVEMKSMSTQTGNDESLLSSSDASTRDGPALTNTVPTIAIHAPLSAPHSRQSSAVLPPHTRNVACQASIRMPVISRSMQTEEIRVDKRPIKLPPNLLPSAITSRPTSPLSKSKRLGDAQRLRPSPDQHSITSPPAREPPPPPHPQESDLAAGTEDAYPGNNDNGPLASGAPSKLRRPVRTGSLFAGFDATGEERADTYKKLDLSDDDSTVGEPIRKTLSKVENAWKLVPQSEANPLLKQQDSTPSTVDRLPSHGRTASTPQGQLVPSSIPQLPANSTTVQTVSQPGSFERPSKSGSLGKEPDVRRAALISSGVAAHSQTTRRPSIPSVAGSEQPPFPVPTRSSSRRPLGSSDGTSSPTPHVASSLSSQRRQSGRFSANKPTLYTIQSVAVLPQGRQHGRQDSGRQSSRPTSSSAAAPDSPRLTPPLPRNDGISQYTHDVQRHRQHHQQSINGSDTATASAISTVDQPSVIDAIAQTMIGEWMWKYVRRRKSFGLSESPQAEFDNGRHHGEMAGNGARHKRWVWLAPYERAIMWSSKQPTSGSALLGKGGRKLAIQSVLDVKDDSPLPKNASPQSMFARSILVLTPQRALKFTATSRDRHYVWLAALSFLSQSSLGPHDLPMLPAYTQPDHRPPSRQEHQQQQQRSGPSSHRNSIRDSLRVVKARARPTIPHANSSPVGTFHSADTIHETDPFHLPHHSSHEAAAAPHVPRSHNHTRQRSNSGPTPVTSFIISNSHTNLTIPLVRAGSSDARTSIRSAGSATESPHSFFDAAALGQLGSGAPVRRPSGTSEGSLTFFDAVGTIRMEAFVEGGSGEVEGECEDGNGNGSGWRQEEDEDRQRSLRGRVQARRAGSLQAQGGGSFPGRGGEYGREKSGSGSLQHERLRRKDLRYWGVEVPGASGVGGPASLRGRGGGPGTGWGEVDDPFEGF